MAQRQEMELSAKYAHWKEWLAALPVRPADDDAELIAVLKDGRNKVYRMRHCADDCADDCASDNGSDNDNDIVVKYFRNAGLGKKLAYALRSSKARRSFLHTQKLRDAGLHCPQAIGWREDWRGPWLAQSFFIAAYVDERYTGWAIKDESIPDTIEKLQEVGSAIAHMHDAELCHGDLTPGNIIFTDDILQLQFIDCNRMSFGRVSREMGMRSLVQMGFEDAHIDPYVESYAMARGFDVGYCQNRYRTLLKRHGLKWKIKNATRPWRRRIGL